MVKMIFKPQNTIYSKNYNLTQWTILSNGEVIKYHIFFSVVVIELSVRCLNTGPEDAVWTGLHNY